MTAVPVADNENPLKPYLGRLVYSKDLGQEIKLFGVQLSMNFFFPYLALPAAAATAARASRRAIRPCSAQAF